MERKIVKHGPATMMISIPAKWIKKQGLKKGDELSIEQKDNYLIIGVDKAKQILETEIDLSVLEESSIRTILTNIYRLGYDKINMKYSDENMFDVIARTVEKNLIGFEIIENKNNVCLIESITEPSKYKFDNVLSKIFLNIEELFDIGEKLLKGEVCEFEDRERKILQFDNFCKRVIAKNNLSENSFLSWGFHSSIVHATRELYHLYVYLSKNNICGSDLELELLKACQDVFRSIYEAYVQQDISILEKVHEDVRKIIYEKGYTAFGQSKDPIIVHHLITAIRHFYLANSPLIGMIIEKN